MKIKISILLILLSFTPCLKAQWVVTDPTNLAQGIVNTAKQIVENSQTAQNTLRGLQESVKIYEQGKQYYDALKSVNNLVKDAQKVQKTVLMVSEITEMYVDGFQQIVNDDNFLPDELTAIAFGYQKLLQESADVIDELKTIINPSSLSMSDAERMSFIDNLYKTVKEYHSLVNYYNRKVLSVAHVRRQQKAERDKLFAVFGSSPLKYW